MAIILGVDPGSRKMGFGLLKQEGEDWVHLDHGVIETKDKMSLPERLYVAYQGLERVFSQYRPEFTVVEKIFLGKNADSAFKLGHVRGLVLQLAWAHESEVFEYAPRSVKKTLTGSGAAEKDQVQMFVCHCLGLRPPIQEDASDALALALSHSRWQENGRRLEGFCRQVQEL